ncbi:MAG: chromate resistance protein ChrB domain-containing protein [Gemmatimonadales bacterium]
MNDSFESFAQEGPSAVRTWLVLMHQVPPKPDYLRVKVRRRLQRIGAVALKNSVYVLPERDDTREDFEWLLREIVADGGEATLCSARLLAGTQNADLEAAFRSGCDAEYAAIQREAGLGGPPERLRRRLEAAMRNDFFGAAGRAAAERAIEGKSPDAVGGPRSAVWITRAGVYIDRIASAWLIRRFIDPAARLRFVTDPDYRAAPGELRFDMFGGDYTHEGDRCTFETLLVRFALDDPALRAIGEMVHDIDLKEERYAREETAGVASIVKGIALSTDDDAERVERGLPVFDGLWARLRSESPGTAAACPSSSTPSAT